MSLIAYRKMQSAYRGSPIGMQWLEGANRRLQIVSEAIMAFRFEGLEIWHKAREFSLKVNQLTASFPPRERYALADQMNRASNAPALLIAEGSGLDTNPLFSHRLGLAVGEICEVASATFMALDRGYITLEKKNEVYEWADELARKINAFRNSLK